MARNSSLSEKPLCQAQRRLSDWINPEGEKKVHSLIDKVYQSQNLRLAWARVKANRGGGGVDRVSISAYEDNLDAELKDLRETLRGGAYKPRPVRRLYIPKPGQPNKRRPLGIPTIRDRVCQQALLNRLEPIFEPDMDDASFGFRRGRSTKDALTKVWREIQGGNEWIVDADLTNFFGTVDHEKLMSLIARRIADGRVLALIQQIITAGYQEEGKLFPTREGTPQGGVISPLLSNVLLTPFDKEMRRLGYDLTRYADDWVVTCRTRQEAERALNRATRILAKLGVMLNPDKTRIVHVRKGFEFLGFKIKRGSKPLQLRPGMIKTSVRKGSLYAYPTQKSIKRFMDRIRALTHRRVPGNEGWLVEDINPLLRGWGSYYCKAHVRRLFNRLDRWIIRRIWSHRHKRWRNKGWKTLPEAKLYGEYGLVSLISLIPSIRPSRRRPAT